MACSVDRRGRSLQDLCGLLSELHSRRGPWKRRRWMGVRGGSRIPRGQGDGGRQPLHPTRDV